MNFTGLEHTKTGSFSEAARRRILSRPGEPLFIADWERVLMIHLEVDRDELQRDVPFQLDLCDGRAFVSIVAFTMRGMRPRFGGRIGALLLRPIGTHNFLNVRTYVRHGGESGIHFLAEWLSHWLASRLGPATFALPYHYGRVVYQHERPYGTLQARVTDETTGLVLKFSSRAASENIFKPCEPGSPAEWLMERYTAFNGSQTRRRFFRVWHLPWQQREVEAQITDDLLLRKRWQWFKDARLAGANYSRGVREVWMGWPHRALAFRFEAAQSS